MSCDNTGQVMGVVAAWQFGTVVAFMIGLVWVVHILVVGRGMIRTRGLGVDRDDDTSLP